MKIYLVGGAVRDKLLGLPIKEKDWVVVGATIQVMLNSGYRQVGKEFPVFLHPQNNEEYALARMEKKVKPGYTGFDFDTSPHVTLEEDLIRRDLTINAMAESEEGELIDPYKGKKDLEQKILRHVSPAFSEDPVRILRLGRFYARFSHLGFTVAPETIALMKKMVQAGEVNALVAERVWKELTRALAEKNPEKFFELLSACGALPILFPHLSPHGPGIQALIAAAKMSDDTSVRFASLLYAQPEDNDAGIPPINAINELCNRYRIPNAYRELALLTSQHFNQALNAGDASAEKLSTLFTSLDIYRREPRFRRFLEACQAIAQSKHLTFDPSRLIAAAAAAKSVNVQEMLAQGLQGPAFASELKAKRRQKIEQWLRNTDDLL